MCVALVVSDDLVTSKYGWNRHVWDVPIEWRFSKLSTPLSNVSLMTM